MQQKSIISTRERKILEQKLSLMFSLRALGQDYSAEYEYVKRKTEELIYTIARSWLLISSDNIAPIYLSIQPNLERLIFSFRISQKTDYISYLTLIIRTRARAIYIRQQEERNRESIYFNSFSFRNWAGELFAPEPEYVVESFETSTGAREAFYESKEKADRLTFTSLKECFNAIVSHVPPAKQFCDQKLSRIYSHLRNMLCRRNFLILLMATGEDFSADILSHLASVLGEDEEYLLAFESFRHEARLKLKRRQEEAREIRNHHYSRLAALANAYENEGEPEKKEELRILRDKCIERLHAKCSSIAQLKCRLSVRDIAKLIDVCPSTVSKAIRDEKEKLEKILSSCAET